jgi:hypothetical protein
VQSDLICASWQALLFQHSSWFGLGVLHKKAAAVLEELEAKCDLTCLICIDTHSLSFVHGNTGIIIESKGCRDAIPTQGFACGWTMT